MPISPDVSRSQLDELSVIYEKAELAMLAAVAERIDEGIEEPGWADRKLAEVRVMRRELAVIAAQATGAVPATVLAALEEARKVGEAAASLDVVAAGGTSQTFVGLSGQAAIEALTAETVGTLRGTHLLAVERTGDAFEKIIREVSAQPLTGTITRRQAAQQAVDRFAARGIRGFTDRAGRTWELATYTEAVTRKAVARSAINGHVERLQALGQDLVIVSNSPQECELCRPLEGKILSLTGAPAPQGVNVWGTLRQAESAGLFHPGCTHSIGIYLEGFTEVPKGTENPQGYEDRQRLRALERQTRKARRAEKVALTPQARSRAQARVRARQASIREHVASTTAKRQPHRERLGVAR